MLFPVKNYYLIWQLSLVISCQLTFSFKTWECANGMCVLCVTCVCKPICITFFKNMVNKSLILTALHWTKMCFNENWDKSECCTACHHAKHSEWRVDVSCQIK
jgi:hypothetical protein